MSVARDAPMGAREWALAWLAGYLALSGTILAVSGSTLLAICHLLLVMASLFLSEPRQRNSRWRVLGDVLPLCCFPALYAELPQLITGLSRAYHDVAVQRWELALFGGYPSQSLARVIPVTFVSELLHASYLAYYPLIVVPPLLLLLRRKRAGLGQTVLALSIVYAVCWTIFVLYPVQGPRYVWPAVPAPDGPCRRLAVRILAAGSSRGAAFPSSHMAVSVVQTMLAWRWQRRVVYVIGPITALIGLGAIYGGFHYAIDIVAGAALGTVVATLVMLDGVTGCGALCSPATASDTVR